MDFATGALGALLPKLAELLQDKYNLPRGAREGIQFLYKEVDRAHAALRAVGDVPWDQLGEMQRIWARDARGLSYDMEDIVDTLMVDFELLEEAPSKKRTKRIVKKLIRKITKTMSRREISQEIVNIKERASRELADRLDRYKVDDIAPVSKTIAVDPRLRALYAEATKFVGIEEAKKEVITMLTEGDGSQNKRIVVSIAGFGGLGKTTLAKAVYDDIKKYYSCTAFVSVSRNPDAKKLLKDMIYELHKGGHPGANLDDINHLIDIVRDSLKNKRYLIVIDDIWTKELWNDVIGHALIENNMGSRIITTTRIIGVAEHIGGCYRLKPLSNESSEILFYGRIFGSKDRCPKEFSEVSKNILKKCGGVPLVIVTISSLLANNKVGTLTVWNDVCNSIGSGLGSMDSIRKILLLSYYDLPSNLKTCLVYLSIFPEDYEITKDVLIWRWAAEGFIHDEIGQSVLEVGESYFNELLNRNLIQLVGMDEEGTPQTCCVHDAVLDLIISLSVEDNFIATWKLERYQFMEIIISKVRRLSLHNSTTWWLTMKMPKLRSLTIFNPDGVVIDSIPSLSCYPLLRVLDLRECKLKDLASMGFLGSLRHLRYLGLSSTRMYEYDGDNPHDQLPKEIGNLWALQTLDISQTEVEELPSSIVRLRQLMRLRGSDDEVTRLPDGVKYLTSLQVLERVVVTSGCIAEELGHLTELRVLDVSIRSPKERVSDKQDHLRACDKALVESLGKLQKIESLSIRYSHFHSGCCLDGSMEPLQNLCRLHIHTILAVPTWINPSSLPGLSYLDISVFKEQREDIQVLATLPCLRHLKFVANCLKEEPTMERCVVGPDAFPSVVSFEFRTNRRGGLVPSLFPPGAMPRLQNFKLRFCLEDFCGEGDARIYTLDDLALGHLPSLRSVNVYGSFYLRDNKATVDDKVITSMNMRRKLEDEAAVHRNHPLRLGVDVVPVWSGSA